MDGVGSGVSYAGETVAQQVPQLATSMGPVAAGAAIGSVVPGIGTLAGAGAGAAAAVAANIAQMYGFNRERQKEENDGEVNEGAAFGTAIPQATIDVASDALILAPLGLGPKALQAGNRARRIMTGAGLGAVSEAPTEAAQQAMERAQAGLELTGDDARKEYVESAVAGGLVGGIFGGGRGALSRSRDEEPTDEVDQDAPDAPLGLPAPALVTPPPERGEDTDAGPEGPTPDPDGDGSTTGQNAGALGGSSPVGAPAFDNIPDEAQVDSEGLGDTAWNIPSPDVDISTEAERNQSVRDGLDAMLNATGIGEVFGQNEYDQTFARLNENGGNVEDAIWEQLKRSADLADQYAEALTEDSTSQQPDATDAGSLEQSEIDGAPETASAEGIEGRDGTDAGQAEVIENADVAETPVQEPTAAPQIENIRKKAAVLRGVPKDQAPEVGGVSLKWDEKEGGFVFSRKHGDKVKAALEVEAEPESEAAPVAKAAEETAPDPTPAQAEAENYRTGKAKWRGLNLSVENKKGSTRSKVGSDGKTAWEVTMPAHYGRILGTVGADGDHVDFYMGDDEASDSVFVVDQIEPETGDFDEQKVMLGFTTEEEARKAYEAGFSDGSGASRLGAMTTWTSDQFDAEIKNPDRWKGPISYSKLKAAEKTDTPSVAKEEVKLKEVKETAATEKEAKVEEAPKQVEEADVPAAAPKPEPETEVKPDSPKEKPSKIEDLGEKIGGARKDTSTPTGPRGSKPKDERPASQRRYEVSEIAADAFNKERVGKFTISDTRSKNGRIPGFMRGQLDFDTREAAEAAIPFIAVSRNHRVMKAGDDFAIVRQVSDRKRPVVKGGFETRDDAMKYMAENAEEIAETKLRIDDSIHPALEEAIRVGEQRRENDRDVSGQDFMDIFGFRGVEFGNWNNNAERQHLLNQAFDAFLDLAEITDMPPKALSLHGEMALAFGARGHGLQGARAHYERNYGVINLTKIKGAGSLAHEWFHAMDHYFARQDGSAKPRNPNAAEGEPIYDAKTPKEDYVSHGFLYKSGMREEVRNEIKNLMAAIMKRKAEYTEDQSSRERISERQIEQVNTHLERIERVLSTEQRYGKKKAPATEEQMQRFQKAAKKIRSGKDLGEKVEAPTKAQYSTFLFYEPVMEIAEVYKEVRGRQAYGRTQNRQHGYAVDLQNAIEVRNQAQQFLDDAKAEKVKEKTVRSEFYSEAWKIDQGTSKDYWSTNHELAARAFESYVYDRLQDIDARNDFLAYEKHNNLPQYKMLNVKPYPEGQERKDINAAFERLFSVIQSKEDADSVMLYQRPLDMFYSPLLKAVSSAKQVKAPAKDWKAIVAKLPGVKKAELEWLGVEEWLDSQEGQQVPREALVAFIRDSQIEVVEERQGERPDGFDADVEVLRNDEVSEDWSDADIEEQVLADAESDGRYSPARFEEYTEDGGNNYREVLLRVPNLHEIGKNRTDKSAASQWEKFNQDILDDLSQPTIGRPMVESPNVQRPKSPFVQSSHFEQENIVVHARVKDRKGADGEKVLFVEEIQSDLASKWRESTEAPEVTERRRELKAEEGRRGLALANARREWWDTLNAAAKGPIGARFDPLSLAMDYVSSGKVPASDRAEGVSFEFSDPEAAFEQAKAIRDARERLDPIRADIIALGTERTVPDDLPDTPFKEEHTYTLMVKRLLREAAEKGYDRLSWTPGYMQAERWNSAAQNVVEGVNWEPGESEGFESHRYVNLEMADNGQTITAVVDDKGLIYGAAGNAELEGKPLSALIGPSLAKQIMAQPEGSVSGQKITFSDSGYAIAYDQQVKRAVDKFAKKYGARVEVDKSLPDFKKFYGQEAGGVLDAITNFGFDEFVRNIEESVPNDKAESFAFSASRARGDMERGNESEAYSNIRIAAINAVGREKILDIIGYQNEGNPVWSIDITPELREAAMEPMSLFRRDADYKSATAATLRKELPALRAQLNKMGLKDVNLRLAKPDSEYQGALRIDRKGGMTMLIGASLDPANTINHEAIHALRAMDLFTEKEWDTLSEAAEGWMQKHSIAERYPDLSKLGQIEEAIAEEYAAWDGKGRGPLAKIKNFLQALGNFLRGKGFQTVDDIYGKVASGEVGGRATTSAEFRGGGADPAVTENDVRALTKDMNAELKQSGLAGKVSVRVVKRLVSLTSGNEILGRFEADKGITVRAAGGVDERGIMRHEIIHALRSPTLWNTSHGLFTPAEWRGLVRAARADKGIRDNVLGRYADQPAAMQSEEMVAEMYRLWAADRDGYSGVETALAKIEAFLGALANLLRGRGFNSAAMTMQRIASGQVGGRGPTSPGRRGGENYSPLESAEMRAPAGAVREKFKGLVGSDHWKDPQGFVSNKLSDAMAGKGDYSLLALVPGRPLFAELGKRLTAAQSYLKHKENMDQTRNDWHSRADTVSQRWLKSRNKDPRANDTLMDLMHRTTLAQVDPTQAYDGSDATWAKKEVARHGEHAPDWAHRKVAEDQRRRKSHRVLREIYDALPPAFQKLYKDIRAEYDAMGDDFEAAVLENVKHSMRVALKRARKEHKKAMQSIKDDGLTGREKADAVAEADEALRKAEQRNEKGAASKLQSLRAQFESNRLTGPYFPLARFGDYFVTVRDDDDQVISFAQFETEAKQQVHIKEMEAKHPGKVQHGLMNKKGALRDQVNPTFVADVEAMLADAEVDDQVLDAIWQRWLSTMPDQSIRTSKIHRKGRAGWNEDAFRAFGKHMFHGAHQLARLKHGVLLEEALDDARDEARVSENPNRAGALVNEMEKRHEFTMNPTGSSVVASMSSLAFLWYLGASPAAAIVNISQTTIVGTPIMAARFTKAGVNGSLSAITKAAKDFGRGKGHVENSANLSADEKKAMAEAYQRGTIDKTQAHDLASVAETGIEYNAHREKWMRRIGWFFHNAERMNREVTFLANYRLARADGLSHAEAVDVGADMTWKIHFDYQNTARPRFMQNDLGKILTTFRQFTVNMLYRMFRDAHQALNGATEAERREARAQLVGITLSMMAHAGIKGTWGYGIAMGLLALFLPGDSDDLEDWMQDALLMEGDDPATAAWNFAMGAALNGAPGQITGANLTERLGMPNLWFRGPGRELEGRDVYAHYVKELLGPVYGIGEGVVRGGFAVAEGDVVRGAESMIPKFVRDIMKTGRYAADGVETWNGDPIVEDVNPWELLLQANGFTPARVAERYEINNRLKNRERKIMDERKDIHKAASDAISAGGPIPEKVMDMVRDFNKRFPEYPITGQTIKQSFRGRQRAKQRNEYGISLNPKLNARLRSEVTLPVYN
ncbi:MAG: PLxRFG domain-containing protein [Sulfitobacter sp.]